MQHVARLIKYFIPDHYQLSLTIDRLNRRFNGTVTIQGALTETTHIKLHAKDLVIHSVLVDGREATFTPGENDELTITQGDLVPGKHLLVVSFEGKITDSMHGLYPCHYEHDGIKKELLVTQFESHHAREVFPCIDEPEAKATFDLTLTTEQNVTALSNMPAASQTVENDKLVTTFATTPRMSTYLLAWVVGELHRKTAVTKNGVEVNIWATPTQKADTLDFALDIATRTIDFFDDYFGVPYPLPKSDHIAVPDFSAGAMENWGLITYREVALLADPITSGISSKQYVALVIAHELSHQWFGNLVTMKWWNNLWLNESFATLMEYIALDALQPEWNVWLDFSTRESILALRRDSIDGVQPVQTEVHHPDEINSLFDGAIVYAKGARLLRMLQYYIGHKAFREGLTSYFQTYAYGNTEGFNLWNELSRASGKDIEALMTPWISQAGYPIVTVMPAEGGLEVTQKQFFIGPHEPSAKQWPIPLNATDPHIPELLTESRITITASSPNHSFRLNAGDSAHFITQYSTQLLEEIIATIGQLSPLDRLQLLHEQTLLARGGELASEKLIPLLLAYTQETEEAVWDIIALALSELRKFVENDPESEAKLKALYQRIARPQYNRLGWHAEADEPESDTKLRATIIGMMLYGEDSEAIREALALYENTSLDQLHPELRALIISAAVRFKDASSGNTIEALFEQYKAATAADLRQDIASGLTSTRDPSVVKQILATLKDATVIRPQDVPHWFIWIIRNRYGRTLSWQWLRDNWAWIEEVYGTDKTYDDFPRFAASALVTRTELDEYRAFFEPLKNEPALTRVIPLSISEIEGRVALIERDSKGVQAALRQL